MEEGMEEGVRWTSFAPHEHDLRMQNRVRDYDSYDSDTRQPVGSEQYVEPPRGSANVKTLLANQQVAGRRKSKPSTVAHHAIRKEGPNWLLLAGGALVAALGVMIARRQKPSALEEKRTFAKAAPGYGKGRLLQSGNSFATTRRESTGSRTSELSTESPYSGDPYMLGLRQPQSLSEGSRVGSDFGDEECTPISPPSMYYSQFAKGSNHSRTIITPTSPPGSYRGADTSATECNDPIGLSPPARLSFSSRRDMVHRLRQQLKSRDEMILDMQAQISDQERTISLHQSHCRELEGRLEAVNKTLFESEREIQRLRKAVADYLGSHVPRSGNWDLSLKPGNGLPTPEPDIKVSIHHTPHKDVNALIRESGRLAEELRAREDEKRELERLAVLRIREHELVVQRLHELEAELEEARKSGFGKDLLLDAYEVEHENLEDKVVSLKRILETKTPENSPASTMIGRRSLSGGVGSLMIDCGNRRDNEEISGSRTEELKQKPRSAVRSYSTLFERSSEQSPRDVSLGKGWMKTDESSSNGDASEDSETEDLNSHFSEKFLVKLQQEVEQLSIILSSHSSMIAEKRRETSRLVDEFQKHNALISDFQKRIDETSEEGKSELMEQDWESFSLSLSFSNDATSASQVQELSHKLEQIAKQQRLEEEIAELSKHQVKIAELKQRVEKLLNKCMTLQGGNGSLDPEALDQAAKMAAAGFDLVDQLALQEELARRTSREVQRLSASFQLSSPYVPRSKKEELRKMLQDVSSESSSPPLDNGPDAPTNMSRVVSVSQSRLSTGSKEKPKESEGILFDRAISFSSAEPATPRSEGCLTLQMEEEYVYRPGCSEPPTRKSRRGFPIISGSSAKEHSGGAKRRTSRGAKRGVSSDREKELVRIDSNRMVDGTRLQAGPSRYSSAYRTSTEPAADLKLFTNHHWSGEHEPASNGKWFRDTPVVYSAPESGNMHVGDIPSVRSRSPVSRRQSGDSFSDSSMMRIGSPTLAGRHGSLNVSIESTKGSFGKFLFDMKEGTDVFVINQEEEEDCRDDNGVQESPPLSPLSQMVSRLDLKEPSRSVSQECVSFGSNVSKFSTEMVNGGRDADKRSGSRSASSISIDSSFDALLDNTLDDLVLVCSTPSSTRAETPESSFTSSQSETKSDDFYRM